MLLDLVNECLVANGLNQTLTATTQGASADFSDGIDSTNMIVNVGGMTTANVTSFVVQCEEWSGVTNGTGNGGTTWAAIPGMVVTVTATTAASNILQLARGLRTQQYVRANANTLAVTTTTAAFTGVCVNIISQKKFIKQTDSGVDRYPST